ncbi:hypothetical protein [Spirosoma koreense]
MASSDNLSNRIYWHWTVLPVLAYLLSWSAGLASLIAFPILVTVAYYLLFRIYPGVSRPGYWFFTLPVTFFIWVKWGPAITYSRPDGILTGVMAYYAGQLINTFLIPLLLERGKPELLLRWVISTSIAAFIWLILLRLIGIVWLMIQLNSSDLAIYFIYPSIALVANGISGFFLTKAYRTDD